jgi:hypothetical protein
VVFDGGIQRVLFQGVTLESCVDIGQLYPRARLHDNEPRDDEPIDIVDGVSGVGRE